mmetsp:Transcript_28179/g.68429  ORF Transcript_28179/g.68429 Transcript_28179/m.68429 type:complete len:315 (-) Transcript_28179:1561-2505(-)
MPMGTAQGCIYGRTHESSSCALLVLRLARLQALGVAPTSRCGSLWSTRSATAAEAGPACVRVTPVSAVSVRVIDIACFAANAHAEAAGVNIAPARAIRRVDDEGIDWASAACRQGSRPRVAPRGARVRGTIGGGSRGVATNHLLVLLARTRNCSWSCQGRVEESFRTNAEVLRRLRTSALKESHTWIHGRAVLESTLEYHHVLVARGDGRPLRQRPSGNVGGSIVEDGGPKGVHGVSERQLRRCESTGVAAGRRKRIRQVSVAVLEKPKNVSEFATVARSHVGEMRVGLLSEKVLKDCVRGSCWVAEQRVRNCI